MADSEQKAQAAYAEAEKKAKSGGGGFLGGLFGRFVPECFGRSKIIRFHFCSGKGEDAADLYIKAANLWKIAKNWNREFVFSVSIFTNECVQKPATHSSNQLNYNCHAPTLSIMRRVITWTQVIVIAKRIQQMPSIVC
jgi:hypothetical protein